MLIRFRLGKRGVEMIHVARETLHRVEELLVTTNGPSTSQFSYACDASIATVQTEF